MELSTTAVLELGGLRGRVEEECFTRVCSVCMCIRVYVCMYMCVCICLCECSHASFTQALGWAQWWVPPADWSTDGVCVSPVEGDSLCVPMGSSVTTDHRYLMDVWCQQKWMLGVGLVILVKWSL